MEKDNEDVKKAMDIKTLPMQVSPEIVEMLIQCKENKIAREAVDEAEHNQLWQLVHDTYPELDAEGNFSLDSTYSNAGIVMLKARKKCDHGKAVLGGLSQLLRAISKD